MPKPQAPCIIKPPPPRASVCAGRVFIRAFSGEPHPVVHLPALKDAKPSSSSAARTSSPGVDDAGGQKRAAGGEGAQNTTAHGNDHIGDEMGRDHWYSPDSGTPAALVRQRRRRRPRGLVGKPFAASFSRAVFGPDWSISPNGAARAQKHRATARIPLCAAMSKSARAGVT